MLIEKRITLKSDTGESNAVGDYRNKPTEFYAQPEPGGKLIIDYMVVLIGGAEKFAPETYGNLAALENGIDILLCRSCEELSMTGGNLIRKNTDWSSMSYDMNLHEKPEGGDVLEVPFKLSYGQKIILSCGDKLKVALNDNFEGLAEHVFYIVAY